MFYCYVLFPQLITIHLITNIKTTCKDNISNEIISKESLNLSKNKINSSSLSFKPEHSLKKEIHDSHDGSNDSACNKSMMIKNQSNSIFDSNLISQLSQQAASDSSPDISKPRGSQNLYDGKSISNEKQTKNPISSQIKNNITETVINSDDSEEHVMDTVKSKKKKNKRKYQSECKNDKISDQLVILKKEKLKLKSDLVVLKKKFNSKFDNPKRFKELQKKKKIRNNRIQTKNIFMKKNLEFTLTISAYFQLNISPSEPFEKVNLENFTSIRDLDIYMNEKIQYIKKMIPEFESQYNINAVSKIHKESLKLTYFCPFCSFIQFIEADVHNMELSMLVELCKFDTSANLISPLSKFFYQINEASNNFSGPISIFTSDFFKKPRDALEEILNIFKSKKIYFVRGVKNKYLHIVFHEFIEKNVAMKNYFLPELQSVIYMFARSNVREICDVNNQNFMVLFYSFYSLNKIFEKMDKNCFAKMQNPDKNIKNITRIISESISFVLRKSFIELIFSCLNIHASALLRYHYIIMQHYHNELLYWLEKKIDHTYLTENFNELILIIITCETPMQFEEFLNCLKKDFFKFYNNNIKNIEYFEDFLAILKRGKHALWRWPD